MIAACPKCHTRYRVQSDQLGPDGARLRCSSCNAVFRVRPPAGAAASSAAAPERAAVRAARAAAPLQGLRSPRPGSSVIEP